MYPIIFIFLLCIFAYMEKYVRKGKHIFQGLIIISNVVYIIWRIQVVPTTSTSDFILGTLLLLAETIGIIQFINFIWLFRKKHRFKKTPLSVYDDDPPTVDILICTYNEPLSLLRKTILASLSITYPNEKKEIYVCDDGNRDELKELCTFYGVNYISRENNIGAKAGNINNALQHTKGELFAILDADMLPMKTFLEATVGYFKDELVSFVQTPQTYYNQDMYQYRIKKDLPNEQDFFMRNIEDARAAHNAVLHVGTNAVFRKSLVAEVGYYPTSSITEDMALGMLLQNAGYKSIFVNKVLVLGLSATTYTELVKQRDRWCRGNLQVMKSFKPLSMKGLSSAQKLIYMDGVIYWCTSIQKMIFIIAPLLYFIFGVRALDTNLHEILYYFLPYILSQILAFQVFSPNTRNIWWAHIYEIAMAPHVSLSVLREVFEVKTAFNVTSKEIISNRSYFQYKIALPHILLSVISLMALIIGVYDFIYGKIDTGAFLINLVWSIYNALAIFFCCILAYQKPIHRKAERVIIDCDFSISINCSTDVFYGSLVDISDEGGKALCNNANKINVSDRLIIRFDDIEIAAIVVRTSKDFLAFKFINASIIEQKKIMEIYMDNIKPYYCPSQL